MRSKYGTKESRQAIAEVVICKRQAGFRVVRSNGIKHNSAHYLCSGCVKVGFVFAYYSK